MEAFWDHFYRKTLAYRIGEYRHAQSMGHVDPYRRRYWASQVVYWRKSTRELIADWRERMERKAA